VLTSFEGPRPGHAFFSPDGRYLAFDRALLHDQHVVMVIPTDRPTEPSGLLSVLGPSHLNNVMGWSPDGAQLFVASDRGGTPALWSLAMRDGSRHGEPVVVRSTIEPQSIGVTATGTLFTVADVGARDVALGELDLARGTVNPRGSIELSAGFNMDPAWSPDGRSLAYVSQRDGATHRRTVAVRSLENGETRSFRPQLSFFEEPSWTPDGRFLVITGKDVAGRPGAYEIDVGTGTVAPLVVHDTTRTFLFHARWSPDGQRLYYRVNEDDTGAGAYAIVEWTRATGREREVIRRKEFLGAPNVSRDGRTIATALGNGAVLLVSLPTGQSRELFRAPGYQPDDVGASLAWARDGTAVLLSAETNRTRPTLWLVPIDGQAPRVIAGPIGLDISLHPNGRSLAFGRRGAQQVEIWALENLLTGSTQGP
jgi:Tol biopolymer transport system component